MVKGFCRFVLCRLGFKGRLSGSNLLSVPPVCESFDERVSSVHSVFSLRRCGVTTAHFARAKHRCLFRNCGTCVRITFDSQVPAAWHVVVFSKCAGCAGLSSQPQAVDEALTCSEHAVHASLAQVQELSRSQDLIREAPPQARLQPDVLVQLGHLLFNDVH